MEYIKSNVNKLSNDFNSLFIGRKGINAHQTAINVTTNNITNVNSIAFKKSSVGFENALTNTTSIGSASNGQLGSTNPKTFRYRCLCL